MLESFVIPELKSRRKLKRTIFQQDGTPPHVCNFVKDLLTSNFNSRVISIGFENERPANSPDLNTVSVIIIRTALELTLSHLKKFLKFQNM